MSKNPTRRSLLNLLMGIGFLATLTGLIAPVVAFLMPLKKSMTSGNILEDANGNPVPADAVAEGHGLVGRLGGRPVLAIRKNGQVLGFSAVCTHLGCIVRWNESSNRIECPCHGGKFDLQGNITGGPPPEALDALTLRIEGNRILRG